MAGREVKTTKNLYTMFLQVKKLIKPSRYKIEKELIELLEEKREEMIGIMGIDMYKKVKKLSYDPYLLAPSYN